MRNMLSTALGALAVLALACGAASAQTPPKVNPDDHILGKPDAPITIIEYASFTCPHCAAFDKETLPKVKKEWIETGKARLIYRHFPFDRAALQAAQLAECAPADKYFGFVDVLFQQQETWSRASNIEAALARIAKLGGMSDEQVKSCLADSKQADKIVEARLVAEKELGVNSTPTFFINGRKVVGAEPYDKFVETLKAVEPKS